MKTDKLLEITKLECEGKNILTRSGDMHGWYFIR